MRQSFFCPDDFLGINKIINTTWVNMQLWIGRYWSGCPKFPKLWDIWQSFLISVSVSKTESLQQLIKFYWYIELPVNMTYTCRRKVASNFLKVIFYLLNPETGIILWTFLICKTRIAESLHLHNDWVSSIFSFFSSSFQYIFINLLDNFSLFYSYVAMQYFCNFFFFFFS